MKEADRLVIEDSLAPQIRGPESNDPNSKKQVESTEEVTDQVKEEYRIGDVKLDEYLMSQSNSIHSNRLRIAFPPDTRMNLKHISLHTWILMYAGIIPSQHGDLETTTKFRRIGRKMEKQELNFTKGLNKSMCKCITLGRKLRKERWRPISLEPRIWSPLASPRSFQA